MLLPRATAARDRRARPPRATAARDRRARPPSQALAILEGLLQEALSHAEHSGEFWSLLDTLLVAGHAGDDAHAARLCAAVMNRALGYPKRV